MLDSEELKHGLQSESGNSEVNQRGVLGGARTRIRARTPETTKTRFFRYARKRRQAMGVSETTNWTVFATALT